MDGLLAIASILPRVFVTMASGINLNVSSTGGHMLQAVMDQFFRQGISGLIPGIMGGLLAVASILPSVFVTMAGGININLNSAGGHMLWAVAEPFFLQGISGLISTTMGWLLAITLIPQLFFGIMASGIPLNPNSTGGHIL
ncbi:hypothetical protein C8R44DRAFT_892298 [Mycena epipterygia]|nr:hypothetical protein C8R44DRAFT_892298 [Mycena epipterygia]